MNPKKQALELTKLDEIEKSEGVEGLLRESQQWPSKLGRLAAVQKLKGNHDALVKIGSGGSLYSDSAFAAIDLLAAANDVDGLLEAGTYAGYRHDLKATLYTVKKLEALILEDKINVLDRTDVTDRVILYSKNRSVKKKITALFEKAGRSKEIDKMLEDHKILAQED